MLEDAKYSPPGTYRPTHRDLPLPSITLFLVALTGAFLLVAFVGMGIVGSAWTDGMGLLVIVLGITAFVQGLRLRNIWNRTRSALAVLWYLDSQEPYLARRVNLREWVRWGTSVGQGSSDIVLGITAFVQGLRLRNIWNRTRSALAVLWYLDSQEPYLARRVNLREWVRWGTSVGQGSSDSAIPVYARPD